MRANRTPRNPGVHNSMLSEQYMLCRRRGEHLDPRSAGAAVGKLYVARSSLVHVVYAPRRADTCCAAPSTATGAPFSASKPLLQALAKLIAATEVASLAPINARAVVPLLFLIVAILTKELGLAPGDTPAATGVALRVIPVDLPPGSGIGSSAALCVAVSAALLGSIGGEQSQCPDGAGRRGVGSGIPGWVPQEPLQQRVNQWAFRGEEVIHGTPSGLDNTISCFGGAIAYSKAPKVTSRLGTLPRVSGIDGVRRFRW